MRLAVLLAVLVAVAFVAVWWRRRDGRLRTIADRFTPSQLSSLGVPPEAAALVEFTSPHCAPCTAARRVLDEVATRLDVAVVPVDVTRALDLARAHHVLRTPTTFVIVPGGRVLGRVSGIPLAADLTRLLGDPAAHVVEPGSTGS
ncbi:MAG: thioredoxin family protein [Egibacteraceae bacterium]